MIFFGVIFFYLNPFAWPLLWFSHWWENRSFAQIQQQTQEMAREIAQEAYETGFRLGLADGKNGIDAPVMCLASQPMRLGYQHGLISSNRLPPIPVGDEIEWIRISKHQRVVS